MDSWFERHGGKASWVGFLLALVALVVTLLGDPTVLTVLLTVSILFFILLAGAFVWFRREEQTIHRFRGLLGRGATVPDKFWDDLQHLLQDNQTADGVERFVHAALLCLPHLREVEYVHQFPSYCRLWESLIETTGGEIQTVQTPHNPRGDFETAFNRYLDKTISKLLEQSDTGDSVIGRYQRLVVVDETSVDQEVSKIHRFLDLLFDKGRSINPTPNYNNVEICAVPRTQAALVFYTNLDVHITSDRSYAIAFHKPEPLGDGYDRNDQHPKGRERLRYDYRWAAALGFQLEHDVGRVFSTVSALRGAFEILWGLGGEGECEVRLARVYDHKRAVSSAERETQEKKVKDQVEAVLRRAASVGAGLAGARRRSNAHSGLGKGA